MPSARISLLSLLGALLALAVAFFIFRRDGTPPPLRPLARVIQRLSTRSPYIYNNGDKVFSYTPPGCRAEQMWLVVRHGARTPSASDIREFKTTLPRLRDQIVERHGLGKGKLTADEISHLRDWRPDPRLKESEKNYLVPQGQEELRGIAKRFKQRFPDLFPQYSNESFRFKYTKTQRAEESAKAFVGTIFGPDEVHRIWFPEPVVADPVLRSYKGCMRWKRDVDNNPEAYTEVRKFEETKIFKTVPPRVTKKLGLTTELSVKDVILIYAACAYETAWNPTNVSPWCAALSDDDLQILEYRRDVEYYWIDGYGYELTYKQACEPIRDIIQNFESYIQNPKESPKLLAHFTHSGLILKLLARLGLFKDNQPLKANNFEVHIARKWRTSDIDTFASNLAILLYRCGNDDYKVGALFQEKPILLPACNGTWDCPFEDFKTRLDHVTNNCDINSFCKI